MAAPKKDTDAYNRLKAWRIRKAIEAGKDVGEEKLAWLKAHEAKKGGRQATPHVNSTRVETNPVEAQATAVPQTAPPPMEVPPLGGAMPAGENTAPTDGAPNASTAPSAESATYGATPPTQSVPSPEAQKAAAVEGIVKMAATAWKGYMSKLAQKVGQTENMFPDEFVDKIWTPAAVRLGVKYLPESVGSDLADAVIVVAPPIATIAAERSVSKKLAEAEQARAEIAAKPAGAPPKESDAPHADIPATASGSGQMTKNEIRKAKAPNLPKDAIF